MSFSQLAGVSGAPELDEVEREQVRSLYNAWKRNAPKHRRRRDYYEDKTTVSFEGIALKEDFARAGSYAIGWCAKAVDQLASRSIFDGFIAADPGVQAIIDSVIDKRAFIGEYSRAVPTELVEGFGLWFVLPSDDGSVSVKYYSGSESAALWSVYDSRIECAFAIGGYERKADGAYYEPNFVVFTNDAVNITLERDGGAWHVTDRTEHAMGRPMAQPMVYKASFEPLGKSRITRNAMRITDEMQREKLLNSIQSRKYSLPTKYMVNASDSLMDSLDKATVYNDEMLVVGKDEDGETVTIGQLQAASPDGHIKQMEHLAREMASESSLPVSSFGGDSSRVYVSSDSLRASSDDIITEARDLNRDNGEALRIVAQMAVAVIVEKPFDRTVDIDVHFQDASRPSDSQTVDALVKLNSMAPWLADTEIFWEWAGKPEDERKRVLRERADAQQLSIAASVFGA